MTLMQYRDIMISKIHRYRTRFANIVYNMPYLVLQGELAMFQRQGRRQVPPGQSILLCDYLHAISCCSTRHTPQNVASLWSSAAFCC
jgi:hypothetical protein